MAKRLTSGGDNQTDTRVAADSPARQPRIRRDRTKKLEELVWFALAVLMVILSVRFFMLLLGARTGVPFVDFWYNLSAPFITPFAGMFGTINTYNTYTGMRIELEALIAMLVYGLVGYLIVLAIRLMKRSNP